MIITIDTLNNTLKVTPQAENELKGVESIEFEGIIPTDALPVIRTTIKQCVEHEIK